GQVSTSPELPSASLTLEPKVYRTLSLSALGWASAVALATMALALATPRPGNVVWDPIRRFRPAMRVVQGAQVGFNEELDMAQTGAIEMTDAIAVTVRVTDSDGAPRDDLPGEQRWRGSVLDYYENGKWRSLYRSGVIGSGIRRSLRRPPIVLPHLGP